jgi:hypothetical protein
MSFKTQSMSIRVNFGPVSRGYGTLRTIERNDVALRWLLYISAHSERHTKQILEVKTDPNFPKN